MEPEPEQQHNMPDAAPGRPAKKHGGEQALVAGGHDNRPPAIMIDEASSKLERSTASTAPLKWDDLTAEMAFSKYKTAAEMTEHEFERMVRDLGDFSQQRIEEMWSEMMETMAEERLSATSSGNFNSASGRRLSVSQAKLLSSTTIPQTVSESVFVDKATRLNFFVKRAQQRKSRTDQLAVGNVVGEARRVAQQRLDAWKHHSPLCCVRKMTRSDRLQPPKVRLEQGTDEQLLVLAGTNASPRSPAQPPLDELEKCCACVIFIHPDEGWRKYWDFWMLALLMYVALFIPLRIGEPSFWFPFLYVTSADSMVAHVNFICICPFSATPYVWLAGFGFDAKPGDVSFVIGARQLAHCCSPVCSFMY